MATWGVKKHVGAQLTVGHGFVGQQALRRGIDPGMAAGQGRRRACLQTRSGQ